MLYDNFVKVYFKNNSYGNAEKINFQLYGFSQDLVKKYWRKMKRFYILPRAKKIENAIIYFNK